MEDEATAEAKGVTARSSKRQQSQKIGILQLQEAAQAAADAAEAAAWASLLEEEEEAGAEW